MEEDNKNNEINYTIEDDEFADNQTNNRCYYYIAIILFTVLFVVYFVFYYPKDNSKKYENYQFTLSKYTNEDLNINLYLQSENEILNTLYYTVKSNCIEDDNSYMYSKLTIIYIHTSQPTSCTIILKLKDNENNQEIYTISDLIIETNYSNSLATETITKNDGGTLQLSETNSNLLSDLSIDIEPNSIEDDVTISISNIKNYLNNITLPEYYRTIGDAFLINPLGLLFNNDILIKIPILYKPNSIEYNDLILISETDTAFTTIDDCLYEFDELNNKHYLSCSIDNVFYKSFFIGYIKKLDQNQIYIDSEPQNAIIYINGVDMELKTPSYIDNIAENSLINIKLYLEGYNELFIEQTNNNINYIYNFTLVEINNTEEYPSIELLIENNETVNEIMFVVNGIVNDENSNTGNVVVAINEKEIISSYTSNQFSVYLTLFEGLNIIYCRITNENGLTSISETYTLYLNSDNNTRKLSQISKHRKLSSLNARHLNETFNTVVAILDWSTYNSDLDIFIVDNENNTWYYGNKEHNNGYIDHDDLYGPGTEIFTWQGVGPKTFRFGVYCFARCPATCSLNIYMNNQDKYSGSYYFWDSNWYFSNSIFDYPSQSYFYNAYTLKISSSYKLISLTNYNNDRIVNNIPVRFNTFNENTVNIEIYTTDQDIKYELTELSNNHTVDVSYMESKTSGTITLTTYNDIKDSYKRKINQLIYELKIFVNQVLQSTIYIVQDEKSQLIQEYINLYEAYPSSPSYFKIPNYNDILDYSQFNIIYNHVGISFYNLSQSSAYSSLAIVDQNVKIAKLIIEKSEILVNFKNAYLNPYLNIYLGKVPYSMNIFGKSIDIDAFVSNYYNESIGSYNYAYAYLYELVTDLFQNYHQITYMHYQSNNKTIHVEAHSYLIENYNAESYDDSIEQLNKKAKFSGNINFVDDFSQITDSDDNYYIDSDIAIKVENNFIKKGIEFGVAVEDNYPEGIIIYSFDASLKIAKIKSKIMLDVDDDDDANDANEVEFTFQFEIPLKFGSNIGIKYKYTKGRGQSFYLLIINRNEDTINEIMMTEELCNIDIVCNEQKFSVLNQYAYLDLSTLSVGITFSNQDFNRNSRSLTDYKLTQYFDISEFIEENTKYKSISDSMILNNGTLTNKISKGIILEKIEHYYYV